MRSEGKPSKKSYIWMGVGMDKYKVVYMHFADNRRAEEATTLLDGFSGYLEVAETNFLGHGQNLGATYEFSKKIQNIKLENENIIDAKINENMADLQRVSEEVMLNNETTLAELLRLKDKTDALENSLEYVKNKDNVADTLANVKDVQANIERQLVDKMDEEIQRMRETTNVVINKELADVKAISDKNSQDNENTLNELITLKDSLVELRDAVQTAATKENTDKYDEYLREVDEKISIAQEQLSESLAAQLSEKVSAINDKNNIKLDEILNNFVTKAGEYAVDKVINSTEFADLMESAKAAQEAADATDNSAIKEQVNDLMDWLSDVERHIEDSKAIAQRAAELAEAVDKDVKVSIGELTEAKDDAFDLLFYIERQQKLLEHGLKFNNNEVEEINSTIDELKELPEQVKEKLSSQSDVYRELFNGLRDGVYKKIDDVERDVLGRVDRVEQESKIVNAKVEQTKQDLQHEVNSLKDQTLK